MEEMESVLKKLNMDVHLENFKRENISPDIVGKLTRNDFKSLGITSSNDMMRLRVECISFGKDRGELKFQISKNMLETLLDSGFSVNDMAKLLSVSERTLYRRMIQYNLQVRSFTDMDDDTLDMHLHEVIAEFPRCGEIMLRQILKTKGLKEKYRDMFEMEGKVKQMEERIVSTEDRYLSQKNQYNEKCSENVGLVATQFHLKQLLEEKNKRILEIDDLEGQVAELKQGRETYKLRMSNIDGSYRKLLMKKQLSKRCSSPIPEVGENKNGISNQQYSDVCFFVPSFCVYRSFVACQVFGMFAKLL